MVMQKLCTGLKFNLATAHVRYTITNIWRRTPAVFEKILDDPQMSTSLLEKYAYHKKGSLVLVDASEKENSLRNEDESDEAIPTCTRTGLNNTHQPVDRQGQRKQQRLRRRAHILSSSSDEGKAPPPHMSHRRSTNDLFGGFPLSKRSKQSASSDIGQNGTGKLAMSKEHGYMSNHVQTRREDGCVACGTAESALLNKGIVVLCVCWYCTHPPPTTAHTHYPRPMCSVLHPPTTAPTHYWLLLGQDFGSQVPTSTFPLSHVPYLDHAGKGWGRRVVLEVSSDSDDNEELGSLDGAISGWFCLFGFFVCLFVVVCLLLLVGWSDAYLETYQ